jgi:hypothetical protein
MGLFSSFFGKKEHSPNMHHCASQGCSECKSILKAKYDADHKVFKEQYKKTDAYLRGKGPNPSYPNGDHPGEN